MRCSVEDVGIHLQGLQVQWAISTSEDEPANWREKYLCGPFKGHWLLCNIGTGGLTYTQKGCVTEEQRRGIGVWDSWQKETPSEQKA